MLKKIVSNDKNLEVNVVISQKKWVAQFLTRKNDRKQSERKSWELTVCCMYCKILSIRHVTKKMWAEVAIVAAASASETIPLLAQDLTIVWPCCLRSYQLSKGCKEQANPFETMVIYVFYRRVNQ